MTTLKLKIIHYKCLPFSKKKKKNIDRMTNEFEKQAKKFVLELKRKNCIMNYSGFNHQKTKLNSYYQQWSEGINCNEIIILQMMTFKIIKIQ